MWPRSKPAENTRSLCCFWEGRGKNVTAGVLQDSNLLDETLYLWYTTVSFFSPSTAERVSILTHFWTLSATQVRLFCCRWVNNCDVTSLGPSSMHYQQGNAMHITRGKRRNHNFYTSHLPFRGQYFAEQKSMSQPKSCLTMRSSPCYFGSLWCQSSISPVTFFQRKSRFPRDSALCNFQCILAHRVRTLLLTLMPSLSAVTWERGN